MQFTVASPLKSHYMNCLSLISASDGLSTEELPVEVPEMWKGSRTGAQLTAGILALPWMRRSLPPHGAPGRTDPGDRRPAHVLPCGPAL